MTDSTGITQDIVTLELDGKQVLVATRYDIEMGVFNQPCAFALQCGTSASAREIADAGQPGKPFQLFIDDQLIFRGIVDEFRIKSTSGASQVIVRGRDMLAKLHDNYVRSEQSFNDTTYAELLQAGLAEVGLKDAIVRYDNNANRKAVTHAAAATSNKSAEARATGLVYAAAIAAGDAINGKTTTEDGGQSQPGGPAAGQKTIQAKLGQRWYDGVLKPEFDRAGLFLWYQGGIKNGDQAIFCLSTPDTSQATTFRLIHKLDVLDNPTNIVDAEWGFSTTARFSSYNVFYRTGGGKKTRTKGDAPGIDQEMVDLGFDRHYSFKDDKAKTTQQAEQLTRRKICEHRRAGWNLTYIVRGHSQIGVNGSRVYFAPDTMVEVDDDVFDLHDRFYLESVHLSRGPETLAELRLWRPADLLFGEPETGFQETTQEAA